MRGRTGIACLLILMAGGTITLVAKSPRNGEDPKIGAVTAIRIANTAEAQYRGSVGRFGSLDDLRSSKAMGEAQSMFPDSVDMSRSAQPLSGFTVRLTLSEDKKEYQISVTQDTKPYSIAFFSDERGLIYEGQPLQ